VAFIISALIVVVFIVIVIGGVGMFKRKMMAAMYTSIIAVIILNIIEPVPSTDGGWALGILVYSIYAVPVIFIYGIFSSVISEKISFHVKKYSNVFSLVLHFLFGFAFVLPYGVIFDSTTFAQHTFGEIFFNPANFFFSIFAVIFFISDYILKRKFISGE
jgi:hypothetical protein